MKVDVIDAKGRSRRVTRTMARALVALGGKYPEPAKLPSMPTPADPVEVLRAEAAAVGVVVDRRWGEARLKSEIAAANAASSVGRYNRRDMRVEDDE